MQAILHIGSQQYEATPGQYLYVPHRAEEPGAEILFKEVLLLDPRDGGQVQVGAPYVENVEVRAEVLEHVKADKCIVFKKKRRKGYRVKNGHRQPYTKVRITAIDTKN